MDETKFPVGVTRPFSSCAKSPEELKMYWQAEAYCLALFACGLQYGQAGVLMTNLLEEFAKYAPPEAYRTYLKVVAYNNEDFNRITAFRQRLLNFVLIETMSEVI